MTSLLQRLAVLGTILLFGAPAVAQNVPETMPYQGFLSRADGSTYEGNVSLTFRIYDGPNAVNPLWQEEFQNVPVTDGKFSVYLGMSNPVINYVTDGRTRYLGISVNGEPEAMPRQAVGSVPYALNARNAGYLGNVRADQYVTFEALTQRMYVTENRVIQLINELAGGAGVNEERVREIVREIVGDGGGLNEDQVNQLIDARNYVNEERVQELINQAVIEGGQGLNADQVNQLIDDRNYLNRAAIIVLINEQIDARNYLSRDAIIALIDERIDARNYVNADQVNQLINNRNYLNREAIEALIDARVAAAVGDIQNQVNQLRQDIQNIQNGGGGVGVRGYILGVTANATTGRLSFNNRNGLAGADEMCRATYADEPTAHLCTWGEVERAVATASWGDNPNFNGVATWTVGPVTAGNFGTSLFNTCQNFLYSSGDVATGTTMTVRLNYQSNGNQGGLTSHVFSVGQNVACGGSFRVLCCR